jgi:hypothetical protein
LGLGRCEVRDGNPAKDEQECNRENAKNWPHDVDSLMASADRESI